MKVTYGILVLTLGAFFAMNAVSASVLDDDTEATSRNKARSNAEISGKA